MATAGNNLSSYKSEDLPNGAHFKVGIVVSEWNSTYTGGMLRGAQEVLAEAGVPEQAVHVHWMPGSYELPLGAQWLAERDDIDGVICMARSFAVRPPTLTTSAAPPPRAFCSSTKTPGSP